MPKHSQADLAINLEGDAKPCFGSIYNLSAEELPVLSDYIDTNLARGSIRPPSSPAAASILFERKKDDELRRCVDYRELH